MKVIMCGISANIFVLLILIFIILCMLYVYGYIDEGIKSPGIGLTDNCELFCEVLVVASGFSGRKASILNYRTISTTPKEWF